MQPVIVQDVLYPLWDMGFKVGHACRSVRECIQQATLDHQNRIALIDARLIAGNADLFTQLQERFQRECILKGQAGFLGMRREDMRSRHEKYSRTVFLQEPNVKESCGGMRDYHNIQWVARKRFLDTFETILSQQGYEPGKFLKRRTNFLKPRTDHEIPVPVRAFVSNEIHPACTTVEIQGLDRIGLLHDLFHTINQHGLNTVHARICTEKGVAMDSLYITTRDGQKIEERSLLQSLEDTFTTLISRPDSSE